MKSTFSRTFFPIAFMLLTALLLVGISFHMLVNNYLTETTMDGLKKDGLVISDLVGTYFSEVPMSSRDFSIALSVASSISDADAVICDATGRLVLCASDPLGCQHTGLVVSTDYLQQVYSSGCLTDTGIVEGLYEDVRYVVSLPIRDSVSGKNLGIVIISTPTSTSRAILERISDIYLFVSVLVVFVAVIMAIIYVRRQSAPLNEMAKAATAFGHGNLTARVKTDGTNSEEVEQLALAFNNMADSLQKSEYQRQEFVANVSHELKTPMTTISGYVDGILDGTIPPERQSHYLRLVSDETKRLSRLVRSMLDISRLQDQGGVPEEQKTRFDIEECGGQVLVSFEPKITAKNLQVEVDMPEHPVYTMANQDYITQVIYNLVDNAVKFSPEGGILGLSVQEGGGKAFISVRNQGETIPSEELPLVFDRFHKIDKSRSQNRDSWGLGLYIVKTIVCSHGEDISVTSRDGITTFTFTLPLVN
ncbi:MAG: sensor histidine kinase [Faecousia sp.]